MPLVKSTKTGQAIYVHDLYPMVIEPAPGGLSSMIVMISPTGTMGWEVAGTVKTLAEQFMQREVHASPLVPPIPR